ncbi:type II toxin-antitoxin system VapC family toxin [Cronobacter turicensis]|nr:type II toxin-antitoxin system VapC family toxin [Cronobacter turicensis]ELY4132850.1 type II toxin-antitoxin system VapC family toxin [Cronobacter turicensis]ELY4352131.1 type II toxin-antitoxin system VapC family toxin [Cronobacter turicensis]ELY6280765.1 type II toxin-antitoxin system VapC family toxin [Cronobacter turicensis]
MGVLAVFDTNILIDLFRGHEKARQTLARFPEKRAISLITWIEVMVGARNYHQEARTREVLGAFTVLPVSLSVAECSVEIRQQCGMKLPDAIILATAQVHSRTLLTRNSKDFGGIAGAEIPYVLN